MRTLSWICMAWLVLAGTLRAEETAKTLPPEIEKLVAEHEATWAKMRTLDVEYQMTASVPLGADPPRPKTGAGRWVRGAGFERLVAERIVDGPDGDEIVCLAEFSVIGGRSRCLIRQIDGSTEGTSYGDEYVRRQLASCTQQWMRQFGVGLGGAKFLRELAAQWTTEVEDAGITREGDRLTKLTFVPPADVTDAGSFVSVYLNLDRGCLVHRVDQLHSHGGREPSYVLQRPARIAVGNVLLATGYLECGDGIWFPAEVRGYLIPECTPECFQRSDDWMGIVQWKTVSAEVNQPLEPSLSNPIVQEANFADSFSSLPQPAILPIRR